KKALKLAQTMALDAGKGSLQKQKQLKSMNMTFKDGQGMATGGDWASEELIKKMIKKTFPSHHLLGEGTWFAQGRQQEKYDHHEFLWVVDPLDGTNNFINNFPYYAISIALVHYGQPVVGVISRPPTGEAFFAVKGQGANMGQL